MRMNDFSYCPSSTYRLQFCKDFTFKQAMEILPYLKSLGVDSVYCSPFYDSTSSHGYDVSDPNKINPDIGSQDEFENFCLLLKKLKIGQIIDVVPNHMGIKGGKNQWWQDVLENGPFSEYASFFDIQWNPDKRELQDRVLICVLPEDYGHVLENQQIKLEYKDEKLQIQFYDFYMPISFQSYSFFLEYGWDEYRIQNIKNKKELNKFERVLEIFKTLPVNSSELRKKKEEGLWRLSYLMGDSSLIRRFINAQLQLFNGKKRVPSSFDLLDKLLDKQYYRLASWKVAAQEINYRRFFNINELAAIRIEEEHVFEAHHKMVFDLVASGKVQGIRIDHPDGLYDPVQYFERLRKKFNVLTVAEKILERKETLPSNWSIDGTVGYEYLNVLNGIFINQDNEEKFNEIYDSLIGIKIDFEELLYEKKKLFAKIYMVSEMNALGFRLDSISEKNRYFKDFTRQDLIKVIQEIIAYFPVYRTYITPEGEVVSKRDAQYLKIAIEKAKCKCPYIDDSVFNFIEKLLLLKLKFKKHEREEFREFILRFQQLSGPIMAKGLEDTCFYIYNRFISLNEVGGDPEHFGTSVQEFHLFNQKKLSNWPLGFLASSTHDTKRSEDVRHRLNVLSEIPEEWASFIKKCLMVNNKHKTQIEGKVYPSQNTEYFIYQTLIGIWPVHLKRNEWVDFQKRVWECLLKSIREAKEDTNWTKPNLEYEQAIQNFLNEILKLDSKNLFLKFFIPFQKKISRLGMWNSLSATLLKLASCGIAEMYQGTEAWDYHLVDPDNRQPVNYRQKEAMLKTIRKESLKTSLDEYVFKLFCSTDLGKIKQFLYWKALHLRKKNPELFLEGEYIPLKVEGQKKDHVIALMRKNEKKIAIIIAARFYSELINQNTQLPLGKEVWQDTQVTLPTGIKQLKVTDLFTDKKYLIRGFAHLDQIFEVLPFALLCSENLETEQ